MARRLVASIVVALVMVMLWAPPASAAYIPAEGAHFNVPPPWGSHAATWRLMHRLDRAIDHTPAGATILFTAFLYDRAKTTDKLVAARNRGVHVRVVLDRDVRTAAANRLATVVNADNIDAPDLETSWGPDGSYLARPRGSARGSRGGNVHTKFYAFSAVCRALQRTRADRCRTPSARNIVMVGSPNPNRGGAVRGWNDLSVMVNRPVTYRGYDEVHREMTEDSPGDGDDLIQLRDGPYLHRFFPMQSATKATDPTMRDLARVRCHRATGGAGINGRTAIHVAMFSWSDTRGEYIARRLLALARDGCRVFVIVGVPSRSVLTLLRNAAKRGVISLYDSRWWFSGGSEPDVRTHHKYMLVSGHVGADRAVWQVWTGSQNWSRGSLTWSDQVTVTITRRSAYSSYLSNWRTVRDHSRRVPRR